jgi:hypothetical protein
MADKRRGSSSMTRTFARRGCAPSWTKRARFPLLCGVVTAGRTTRAVVPEPGVLSITMSPPNRFTMP